MEAHSALLSVRVPRDSEQLKTVGAVDENFSDERRAHGVLRRAAEVGQPEDGGVKPVGAVRHGGRRDVHQKPKKGMEEKESAEVRHTAVYSYTEVWSKPYRTGAGTDTSTFLLFCFVHAVRFYAASAFPAKTFANNASTSAPSTLSASSSDIPASSPLSRPSSAARTSAISAGCSANIQC